MRPRIVLARLLLSSQLLLGVGAWVSLGASACLPPDYEVEPDVNHPVTIDRTQVTPDPRQFAVISSCSAVTFRLGGAVSDPDASDPLSVVWLVNYQPGQGAEPDYIGRAQFTFDPCTNPKAVVRQDLMVMVVVLDRPVPPTLNADEILAYDAQSVTRDFVTWAVTGFDDRSCCLAGGGP